MPAPEVTIRRIGARAYRIPTDGPEADGTIAWDSTTLVLVEAEAGGAVGLGYSYADAAAANIVASVLAPALCGGDAFDIPQLWAAMVARVRNIGWPGLCATAISAVDAALWDLKAKLFGVPLVRLLGAARAEAPIYGSGGFTTYDDERLCRQLAGWVERDGCRAVKLKIGSDGDRAVSRVRAARRAIGAAELYMDANGAMARKQALACAEVCTGLGVTWFEEPVSSDDLEGLRLLRDRSPAGMDIVAGEYGYQPFYFQRLLRAGAVDVMQADASRCGGISGFLSAAALVDAAMLPLSTHTAPALHLHVACAAPRLKNVEWFHDHVRIEQMLFDGAPAPRNGAIAPDLSRHGFGLEFKHADARRFAV